MEIFADFGEQLVGKIAIFEEIGAVLEVDNGDFGVDGSGFGLLREFDEGIVGLGEVIVDDIGGGGAGDAGNLALASNKTS